MWSTSKKNGVWKKLSPNDSTTQPTTIATAVTEVMLDRHLMRPKLEKIRAVGRILGGAEQVVRVLELAHRSNISDFVCRNEAYPMWLKFDWDVTAVTLVIFVIIYRVGKFFVWVTLAPFIFLWRAVTGRGKKKKAKRD